MKKLELDYATRLEFWKQLKIRAHNRDFPLHDHGSLGGKDKKAQSLYAGAGERNVGYHYWLCPEQAPRVSLSIYDTKERARNQALFDNLDQRRTTIEDAFGEPLAWIRVIPNNLGCSIGYCINQCSPPNPTDWTLWHDTMVDAMQRLHGAIQPYVDALPQELRRPSRPRHATVTGDLHSER